MSHSAPHPHQIMPSQGRPGPKQHTGGHPAVMSLQREVSMALDAQALPEVRAASLSKLHTAMASYRISRPSVAVASLPWFLSNWPQLVSCLWDSHPQVPPAVAPLLGLVGGLVASSRAAAAAAEAEAQSAAPAAADTPGTPTTPSSGGAAAAGGPPPPPPSLLFDWLLPLLTGKVPLPTGSPAPLQLQVLICKTLVYALQQLPSCGTPKTPAVASEASAGADADAADSKAAASVATAVAAPAAGDGRQQKPAALLAAPVAPAASQQLHQHATAVLAAVQELLEAAATPPALLAPLLQVLLEVVRLDVTAVTGEVLCDLLDLLLGWSLEPGLQPKDRQLISKVLSSCKPCWLAEPELLHKVSSKLLADLQQQLPALTTAATPNEVPQLEATAAADQQQPEQHKFLALLSCLVAVLHAAVVESRFSGVVSDTAALMLKAHSTFSRLSETHREDYEHCSSAATVAALMMGLSRSIVAAVAAGDSSRTAAETSSNSGCQQTTAASEEVTSDAHRANHVESCTDVGLVLKLWQVTVQTLQLPQLTVDLAVGVLESLNSTLMAVASTASTLCSPAPADEPAPSEEVHSGVGVSDLKQQQQQQQGGTSEGLRELASQMSGVYTSTLSVRCSDMPGAQAAAAALLTTALAVSITITPAVEGELVIDSVLSELVACSSHLSNRLSSHSYNISNKVAPQETNPLLQVQQQEPSHKTTAASRETECRGLDENAQPSHADLSQQQLVGVLVYDLVLLEGWINSCVRHLQQQQVAAEPTEGATSAAVAQLAVVIADGIVKASAKIAEALHQVLQQLSTLCIGSSFCNDIDSNGVVEQAVVAIQSLCELFQALRFRKSEFIETDSSRTCGLSRSSPQRCTMSISQIVDTLQQHLLAALQLLLSPSTPSDIQCLATALLVKLVWLPGSAASEPQQQQQQQQAVVGMEAASNQGSAPETALSSDHSSWQQVVMLLTTAASSNDAAVRVAATAATAELATALWLHTDNMHQSLLGYLPALLSVLVQRSQDIDAETAASAQFAAAKLVLPLYLITAAGPAFLVSSSISGASRQTATAGLVGKDSAWQAGQHSHQATTGSTAGPSWVRAAALQPQQRAFKPMQLAQLFDLLFQASPLLLQRRPAAAAAAAAEVAPSGAAAAVLQLAQQKFVAQTEGLHRLAQSLPVLPAAAQADSSKPSSSSSSKSRGSKVSFDALDSVAALKWLLIQDSARHCVNARLRTHLGNPVQTFTALEKILQSMSSKLHNDGSPAAVQRAWQHRLVQQLQAVLPQQQPVAGQQQQQEGQEPQLLQAAAGGLVSRAAAAHKQQSEAEASRPTAAATPEAQGAVEQQRLESEVSASALLDFMWAVEVGIQSAAEGSLLRPEVGKAVMTFFAGNRKVCGEWFSRTRESLLGLSAAAGAVQHTVYHGMARMRELHTALKAMDAHLQAQQLQLQQAKEAEIQQQVKPHQQQSSTGREAAAAAAAAVSGLGSHQGDRKGRGGKQHSKARQQQHQQQQKQQQQATEQMKLKAKLPTSTSTASDGSQAAAPVAYQEGLRKLQQQHQASVLRLVGPLMSGLVLLVDALVAAAEGAAISGLQCWIHDTFLDVWQGISRRYALDITTGSYDDVDGSAAADGSSAQTSSTQLLLSWLPAAAAQADGRYEAALQAYHDFLQSPACSVPVASCLKEFITEQMAACYAAVGDWQGLQTLSRGLAANTAQQKQLFGAQHWVLAGPAAVDALQHWDHVAPSITSQQQQQQQQRVGPQHKAHRGSAACHHAGPIGEQQTEQHHLHLMQSHWTGLTAAQQVILRAMQPSSNSRGPAATSARQQQQRGRGRGRSRQSVRQADDDVDGSQHQSASSVLADLQSELQAISQNPLYLVSAVSGSSGDPVACGGQGTENPTNKLQQLALMQLLQETLEQQRTMAATMNSHDSTLSKPRLQGAVGALISSFSHSEQLPCSTYIPSTSSSVLWDDALRADGKLHPPCFSGLSSVMPLVQVLASHRTNKRQQHKPDALDHLLKEALLACHAYECGNAKSRILQLAEAHSSSKTGGELHEQQQAWLQLVKTRMLATEGCSSSVLGDAVSAHLKVLQPFWPIVSDSSSVSSSSSRSAVAAAYLSLAELLIVAATAPVGDWMQLQQASWQQVQQQQQQQQHNGQHSIQPFSRTTQWGTVEHVAAAGAAVPASILPQVACCSAAAAAAPANHTAWKALGDLLFTYARDVCTKPPTSGNAVTDLTASQKQQQQRLLYTAACEAYSNYLLTAVHTRALSSPEAGLGVLLRLLQVATDHGDALQQQLQHIFGSIPVSAWQGLTPQLLGQLQHSSAAVRGLVQQVLQGLVVLVPCAVLYPLVVEVRAAEEAGQQAPAELSAVLSQLQSQQPRLLADTCAMASALAQLTVTPREAWAGVLAEVGVEVNRKLLALQADAARQSKQGLTMERRKELLTNRYHTVMSPVLAALQQHLAAATAAAPGSPDEAAFRQDMLPKIEVLLEQLRAPPAELLAVLDEQQQDRHSSTDGQQQAAQGHDSKGAAAVKGGISPGGWAPLKKLQQQLAQQLRQQHHLDLAAVAPLLASLRNTAIPLPADDLTDTALPPTPLHAVLNGTPHHQQQRPIPGAALAATASDDGDGSTGAGSWLCIAGFDKTVLVLPTKTRPKRLRLLATDGSVHAFLLKGRDDLRVDERIMQFMRTANHLLSGSCSSRRGDRKLSVRPYSITPFGRRAGLVQWVRHTSSLFGVVRSWQAAAAERYQALAAAKREAATAATAQPAAADGGKAPDAADGAAGASAAGTSTGAAGTVVAGAKDGERSGDGVVLPLMVAAARPVDAYYARLLPALQAAGVPVGAPRSSWPAAALRSAFLSLQREAPKHLLRQQLLSSSAHPSSWWSSQQCFTTSTAVGSMLGWLLGLGDRHLDNLLLDTDSGELLHIDFSVCFDKGAGLAVPEVVPFRLTQLMQVALGPGGVAGGFSAAACTVLTVLRQSSELLSSLLALLLSDPAVDWSVEREAHAAKKDQDTAVSLNLFASRIDELRPQLLSGLATTLPIIGNGLAAVVSYGEAHVYMHQLQSSAAAARARAAAAQTALTEASADEVRALTQGGDASQRLTAGTADYRRLCGLAAGSIASAANWLSRHEQTLQTLLLAPLAALNASGSPTAAFADVGDLRCLVADPQVWDADICDRPLMLLGPTSEPSTSSSSSSSTGIIAQSLHPLIAVSSSSSSSSSTELIVLLPAELYQQCVAVDAQGRQVLQQLTRLAKLGRWAVGAYSITLQQLLPGTYVQQSHHWCWSHAFRTAASGPLRVNLAAATAATPVIPPATDVASVWSCLVACWVTCQQQLQQHTADVAAAGAAAAGVSDTGLIEGCNDADLRGILQQLEAQLGTGSEADSAQVQLTASTALGMLCTQVATAAQQLQQQADSAQCQHQQMSNSCLGLQESLAGLQAVMLEFRQTDLSYILDLSASSLMAELPGAAASLEDLLDQHEDDEEQLQLALQQQQQQPGQQHQWVPEAAGQLQLVLQLLSAVQYEALPALTAWAAAAATAESASGSTTGLAVSTAAVSAMQSPSAAEAPGVVMLQAGPVSQLQLWVASRQLVNQCWQHLQQQLEHAQQLEAQMQALAAVAAAGGAAGLGPGNAALAAQVEMLQKVLLPQGYDVLYMEDCVLAAQLLQVQWGEVERGFVATAASCLCPLLGLTPLGPEYWLSPDDTANEGGFLSPPAAGDHASAVLQQLLDAAAASVASGAIMHSKDVFDALAGSAAAGSGGAAVSAASSSSEGPSNLCMQWGTPTLSDAWKSLVVLLLQCGCAQYNTQQQQPPGDDAGVGTDNPAAVGFDVVKDSRPLPLDLDSYRPLVFVLQMLKSLLEPAVSATAEPVSSPFEHMQQVLLSALVRPLLHPLQQQLGHLMHHLQAMCSEAESVLTRQQQQPLQRLSDEPPTASATPTPASHLIPGEQWKGGSELEALVPFNAFDDSLPGADMVLEEELEEPHSSSEAVAELPAAFGGGSGHQSWAASGGTELQADVSGDMLSGLDWLDDEALQQSKDSTGGNSSANSKAGSEPGCSLHDAGSAAAGAAGNVPADLPQLVPFDAFDPSLPGAGSLLEDDGLLGGLDDSPNDGKLGEDITYELPVDIIADPGAMQERMLHTAGHEALGQLCLSVGRQAAHKLLQEQRQVGLEQAAASCAWQQQVWLKHLAAFEWIWGDVLEQLQGGEPLIPAKEQLKQLVQASSASIAAASGGAASDAHIASSVNGQAVSVLIAAASSGNLQPGAAFQHYFWEQRHLELLPEHPDRGSSDGALMPSRQQLLLAWQEIAESVPAVEAGLSAWQAASASSVHAVRSVLVEAACAGQQMLGDPTICLKVLSGLFTRCQSWCAGAAAVLGGLSQLSEASLQLEFSRRGTLWAPGAPAGVDAFQGHAALLAQLQVAIKELLDAEAAAEEAKKLLTSSLAAAQQAEVTIDEAAAEEAAAEHELVLRTPAAISRAQGLSGALNPMIEAADSALGLVTEGLGSMFRALSTLVEKSSAARDLSPIVAETVAQHNRCTAVLTRLRDIGASAAAGLHEALLLHQQQLTGDEQRDQQQLLKLLLVHMQPALQGVQQELHELGQAHILFTQLTHQLDSLAAAAQTVSAAITTEHAMQLPAAAAHGKDASQSASRPGASSVRVQRAEARRRAFASSAMQRCLARLLGGNSSRGGGGGGGGGAAAAAASHHPKPGSVAVSAADEVAALVEAATSVDNLCRMYEGWTPWL